jgi:antirestriction protein ArdC
MDETQKGGRVMAKVSSGSDGADRAEKVRALHDQLVEGVRALTTSEDWTRALDTAARFHRYSARNALLIQIQRPDASRVAGYRTWQSLGRQVRKGERGIAILAPCTYKRTTTDRETGEERESIALRGFRAEHVFDVSQTDGEPLDEVRPMLLQGDGPEGLWNALAAQVQGRGFALERGDCQGRNGYTDFGARVVRVRADVDQAQATKTLAHELAHICLGHSGCITDSRSRAEVEAESTAFVVMSACGARTDDYSLPYVAHWAGGEIQRVLETAERVQATARGILEAIAR